MTVGWINREEFGVADGGGGRFVGEGHASPTTEWLTEDERVGTSGWGFSPFTVITDGPIIACVSPSPVWPMDRVSAPTR